jgi:hypothetical protein
MYVKNSVDNVSSVDTQHDNGLREFSKVYLVIKFSSPTYLPPLGKLNILFSNHPRRDNGCRCSLLTFFCDKTSGSLIIRVDNGEFFPLT